ncbi:MAG: S41 family peptidase [Lachnospiraceae bacterium]|jgi:carboxyl-terminal processing protease|nr:S41 family peptidase [Lachnospiraceae bacterium]
MKKSTKYTMIGIIIFLAFVLIFETTYLFLVVNSYSLSSSRGKEGAARKAVILENIDSLENMIDQFYLFDYEKEDLETGVYKGLIAGLDDPYSVYYTPEEYNKLMEMTTGEYSGIGALLSQDKETGLITVVKPYKGTPSEEAGLLPGDVFTKVDGQDTAGMDLATFVNFVKGESGTEVVLEVYRTSEKVYKTFRIKRRTIETPTVEYEMLEDNIGYIAISEFEDVTYNQFVRAVEQGEKEGMKGLIIDVRNNPGGVVTAVCKVLDYMVPDGDILMSTKDKEGNGSAVTGEDGHFFDQPLVVLINGESASASEIFAGGIRDYEMGTLVGEKTYGKGIVQRIFHVGNGAGVKLTVQEYYLPSGVSIHEKGVEPDVEEIMPEELKYQLEIKKEEDTQLQKGMEILREQIG